MINFKVPIIRDRGYLDWLRDQPCAATNRFPPSDPAHVRSGSNGGTGMKPSDDNALPLSHNEHAEQHRIGEIAYWRDRIMKDDWLLMRCVRALAHEYYNEYKRLK